MAKFYGTVGYAKTVETRPGVWEEVIIDKKYSGEVVRNNVKLSSTSTLNDNVSVSNTISILADPFANENFHNIRFVDYMGTKWKISNIEVQYPRLILTMGGVYNG